MLKGILVSLCILALSAQPSYAGWFDDLWGPEVGTYWWLRNGDPAPSDITELDPYSYYDSSNFDDGYSNYTLQANEYLRVDDLSRDKGVNINTDNFTNLGYIRVYYEGRSDGIYSLDYFSGTITNSGAIYVGSDSSAWGMSFDSDVLGSTITNSGDILAEVSLSYIDYAYGYAYGLGFYSVSDSAITNSNSGSITARVEINEADYYAEGYAYGMTAFDNVSGSEIDNSGNILAEVSLSYIYSEAYGYAYGLGFYSVRDSTITNSGDILAEVSLSGIGEYAYGYAYGLYLSYVENSPITNSGSITARVNITESGEAGGYAYGMDFDNVLWSTITNSGDILAEASLSYIGDYPYGEAYGLYLGYVENSPITNSGSITARVNITESGQAGGYAYGMDFNNVLGSTITNSGDILAEASLSYIGNYAYGEAYGLGFYSVRDSTITNSNSGSITARVNITESGQAGGYAYGMRFGDVSGTEMDNSGDILAEVSLSGIGDYAYGEAYGLYLGYMGNSTITNSGSINVSFNAVDSSVENFCLSGMHVDYDSNSTINNSGTINVLPSLNNSTVQNFRVTGISVFGGDIAVNNSGLIALDVAGLGETNENFGGGGARIASAVLFSGTNANFSNTGRIYTSGNARALSLYNNSRVTLQNGFGYMFHGDPATIKRPIYVDGTGILNLNSVPLHAYGVFSGSSQTVLGTPYYLLEKADGGTVDGTWSDLISMVANPDIRVSWYGADRGADSAVVFNFAPQAAPTLTGNIAALAGLFLAQTQFSNLILENNIFSILVEEASAGSEPLLFASAGMSDAFSIKNQGGLYKNGVYLLPYYTRVNDSGLGADMDSTGFLLGFEKKFGSTVAGLFAGYGRNDVDFTGRYRGNSEDQDVYNLGVYGIYNADKWFADLFANYDSIKQDYTGWTGMNLDLRETDKYDSNAFTMQAKGGLKFEGGDWGIYPSIGLRWTYWQTESHTTDVSDPSWRRSYSSIHDNWFQLLAGVDASKKWTLQNKGAFKLRAGLKLEQALNDNEISVAQSLQGQRAVTKQSMGDTSIIGNLSAAYSKDIFRIRLGVMSQHNSDYNAYSGYVQIGLVW